MFQLQVCFLVGLVISVHLSTGQLPIPEDLPIYRLIPPNCRLVPVSGLCQDRMMRYFYNLTSETCEPFAYTGCNGNSNNFMTEADCKSACMCAQPLQTGRCHSRFHLGLRRTFFDAMSGECKQLHSARCQINSNVFPTMTQCQGTCSVCGLSVDTGPCNGNYTRFFFKKASRRCEPFAYSGCGGNANNFLSLANCDKKCSIQKKNFSVRLINSGNRLRQSPTLSSLLTVRLPETLRRLSSYSRTSGPQKVNRDTILQNSVHSKQASTMSNLKTVTRNMMRVNLTSLSRNQRRRIQLNIPRPRRTRPTLSNGANLPVFAGNRSADSVQLTQNAEIREIGEYYTEVPTEPAEIENPPIAASKTQTRKQIYHPKMYRIRFRFGVPSASRSTKTFRSGVVHQPSTTAILPRSPDQKGSSKALSNQAIVSETIQITHVDENTNNSKPASITPQSHTVDTTSTSRATVAKPMLRKPGASHKANSLTGSRNRVKETRALFRLNQNKTNSFLTSSKPNLAVSMSNSRSDMTAQRHLGFSRQISSPYSTVSPGTLAAGDMILNKEVNKTTSALKLELAANQQNIIMKQTSMKLSPLRDSPEASRVVIKSSAFLGSTTSGAAILSQTATVPKLVIPADSNNVSVATDRPLIPSNKSAGPGRSLPIKAATSQVFRLDHSPNIRLDSDVSVKKKTLGSNRLLHKRLLVPISRMIPKTQAPTQMKSSAVSKIASTHVKSAINSKSVSIAFPQAKLATNLNIAPKPLPQVSRHATSALHSTVVHEYLPKATATEESNVASRTLSHLPAQAVSTVESKVESRTMTQLSTQVPSTVESNVASGTLSQLSTQVASSVESNVASGTLSQLPTQVASTVESKVASRTLSQLPTQVESTVESKVASRTLPRLPKQAVSTIGYNVAFNTFTQLPIQATIIDSNTAHQTSNKTQQKVTSVVDSKLAVLPSVLIETSSATNYNLTSNVTSQVSAMVMPAEAKVPNAATYNVPQHLPDSIANLPIFRPQSFSSSTYTRQARTKEPSVLPTLSSHPPQNADLKTSDRVMSLPVFRGQTTQWDTNSVPVQNIQGSNMYSSYQSPEFLGDVSTTEAYTDYIQSIYEHSL